MSTANERQRCTRCRAWLASDNATTGLCSRCQPASSTASTMPPEVPAEFWLDAAVQAALSTRHMGCVIHAYRNHPHHGRRALTQTVVASWAGMTQGQLSTIERGPVINQLDRLISWAQLLGIPEEHLWFKLPADRLPPGVVEHAPVAGAQSPGPLGDDSARQDESSMAERASALGVDLWELLDVLEARRLSTTGLALAEHGCAQLDARYAELPPSVLLPELRHQLNHVVSWLKEAQPVAYRRRLSTLAGRLAGLRAWLYFDMAELDAANAWFAAGVRAAQEAEDNDLCAYLLGAQSLIPVDGNDYRAAAQLLEAGQERATRGRQTTRAWLDILQARVLAGSGDDRGFRTAHRLAEKRAPRTTPDERLHGMDFAGDTLDLTYYEGLSHLLLGRPHAAADAFEHALNALPETRVKARAVLSLTLAVALARGQQFDRAVVLATDALDISGDQPIRRVVERAQDVRQALGPAAQDAAAREFDDKLAAFVGWLERNALESSP